MGALKKTLIGIAVVGGVVAAGVYAKRRMDEAVAEVGESEAEFVGPEVGQAWRRAQRANAPREALDAFVRDVAYQLVYLTNGSDEDTERAKKVVKGLIGEVATWFKDGSTATETATHLMKRYNWKPGTDFTLASDLDDFTVWKSEVASKLVGYYDGDAPRFKVIDAAARLVNTRAVVREMYDEKLSTTNAAYALHVQCNWEPEEHKSVKHLAEAGDPESDDSEDTAEKEA